MNTNLVTNQNLSERLRDLGVPQKSTFIWQPHYGSDFRIVLSVERLGYLEEDSCSAFLSGELGEMFGNHLSITKGSKYWYAQYWWGEAPDVLRTSISDYHRVKSESLADALGELLEYLIEHQIIDVATLKI